jgi:hypothetical protein
MPILNWSDIVEVTHDEAKQTCLDYLETVGFAATSWQEGSVPLACVELSAEIWSQLSSVAVFLKTMGLNDTAQGDALTRYSSSQYDNERNLATNAQRLISLSCSVDAGPHTFNVGDVVIEHPDGPTYRNVEDGVNIYPVTLPSGGSVSSLIFEAEIAGEDANKGSNTVNRIVTTLAGVTISSDQLLKSGANAESDPRLQQRNKTKWSLLTRYELIRDAVVQLTLSSSKGIQVVEVDDQNPRGAGTFDVWIANALTPAADEDVTAAQTLLDRYIMGSGAPDKPCLVRKALEQQLNITGTVYYKGATTEADMQSATLAALNEFIKTIPLGGFNFFPGPTQVVPKNDIEDVIREVRVADQRVSKTVVLTVPSGDVAVASYAKVTLGVVALTFVRSTN